MRQERGWTQQRVADEMRKRGHAWYQTTTAKVEAGDRPVTLSEAVALGRIFECGLDEMTEVEVDAPPDDREHSQRSEAEAIALVHRANDLRVRVAAFEKELDAAIDEVIQAEQRVAAAKKAMEELSAARRQARRELDDAMMRIHDILGDDVALQVRAGTFVVKRMPLDGPLGRSPASTRWFPTRRKRMRS